MAVVSVGDIEHVIYPGVKSSQAMKCQVIIRAGLAQWPNHDFRFHPQEVAMIQQFS